MNRSLTAFNSSVERPQKNCLVLMQSYLLIKFKVNEHVVTVS